MISRQMELRFESGPSMMPLRRRQSRSNRANWWFEKMRGVVDHARDWPPATPPRTLDRALTVQSTSVAPSPDGAFRSSRAEPTAGATHPSSAPVAHRWQFGRTRRLVWE